MLEEIRNTINQKREFLESAEILFEDTIPSPLNQFSDMIDDDIITESGDEGDAMGPDFTEENEADADDTGEDDIMNTPIDGSDDTEDDAGDSNMDHTSVVVDDEDDLLSVTINTKSGTVSDILPVAPDNAETAVLESYDDLINTEINFNEAISMGDDSTSAGTPETPEDGAGKATDTTEENEVTSAVKDKVAETEMEPDDDLPATDDEGNAATIDISKEDGSVIIDNVNKLNKDISDIKKKIMRAMGQ